MDEEIELPCQVYAKWYAGYRGSRDSYGASLEPDEEAYWDIENAYFYLNGEWYEFELSDEQIRQVMEYLEGLADEF